MTHEQECIIEELENICINNEYVLELLAKLKNEEEPTGEWIEEKLRCGNILHCSECGARPRRSEYGYDLRDNFCHNCGADMRGKKE